MSEILGNAPSEETTKRAENFIQEFIEQDLAEGKVQTVKTRFPPEPNGYLHIGHAKALWIDFSTAEKYGGSCNLRFDDTNPAKEDEEFVDAIMEDIHWLGYSWDKLCYGSSYFDQCYELAIKLIQKGVAYVDDLSKDEMREYRGTLTEPGKNSPFRDRSVEENLDLFTRMKNGEFPDGSHTLRARSTWLRRTSTCATRHCTAFCTFRTIRRAIHGASIRCMTLRTRSRTPSRASRTRCARSNTRRTVRCTTGW